MGTGRKILIIDDDTELLDAVAKLLSRHEVRAAASGDAGLAMASAEAPQLVLLDVTMPGTGGLAVLGKLRRMSPPPVVVMLSADVELGTAVKALSLGAYAYITKPFDPDWVNETVEAALDQYDRENPRR
mgnify:CR=1 FL=1